MAYIDEVEQPSNDRSRSNPKLYYSTLVKAALPTKSIDSQEPVQNLDQVKLTRILDISNMFIFCIKVFLNTES